MKYITAKDRMRFALANYFYFQHLSVYCNVVPIPSALVFWIQPQHTPAPVKMVIRLRVKMEKIAPTLFLIQQYRLQQQI